MQRRKFLKWFGVGASVPAAVMGASQIKPEPVVKHKPVRLRKDMVEARKSIQMVDFSPPKPPEPTRSNKPLFPLEEQTGWLQGCGGQVLELKGGYPRWADKEDLVTFNFPGGANVSIEDIIRTLQAQEIEIERLKNDRMH